MEGDKWFDGGLWSLLWPESVVDAIRDAVLGCWRAVREWLDWLFDLERIVNLALGWMEKFWLFVEAKLPTGAVDALQSFFTLWSGGEFGKLVKLLLWGLDQLMFGNVVVSLCMVALGLLPLFLVLHMVLWVVVLLRGGGGTGNGK